MLNSIVLTIAVWTGIALIAGIFIGRRLRRRAAAHEPGRSEFRKRA